MLITVHLLGAVGRAGVYHVPKTTDLIHLLSLSGGVHLDADLTRISIKRRNKENEEVLNINLEKVTGDAGTHPPILQSGDVVLVYPIAPLLGRDTMSVIQTLGTLLSLATSLIIITRTFR